MRIKPSINWLLIFIPITLALEHTGVPAPYVFFSAALAIVPIASLVVQATEQIATRSGDAVGGLLNATFGNAPALIIAFVALKAGLLDMLRASLIGAILANILLALGAAFLLGAVRWFDHSSALSDKRLWPPTWLLIRVAGWLVLLHLIEISARGLLYAWWHALPDGHSAFYFSSVTYTTVGYGDLALPEPWRLIGGIEALTGILMCGWSTSFFFAILSNRYRSQQA